MLLTALISGGRYSFAGLYASQPQLLNPSRLSADAADYADDISEPHLRNLRHPRTVPQFSQHSLKADERFVSVDLVKS